MLILSSGLINISIMCGIFGFSSDNSTPLDVDQLESEINMMFLESQERGRGAAGIGVQQLNDSHVFKRFLSPNEFVKSKEYQAFIQGQLSDFKPQVSFSIIGQCRLSTSGSLAVYSNNQPIDCGPLLGVHNGIVTKIASKSVVFQEGELPSRGKESRNDSSLLLNYLVHLLREQGDLGDALRALFSNVQGSFSIAGLIPGQQQMVLATNVGSLYYVLSKQKRFSFFSERGLLQNYLRQSRLFSSAEEIHQVPAGTALILNTRTMEVDKIDSSAPSVVKFPVVDSKNKIKHCRPGPKDLQRCAKCVLPESYPFIKFNSEGVCNYCSHYEKQKVYGEAALLRELDNFRSKDGSPDCLVGLSGGRDSCYGLYLLKEKYGMNPIAYTFDWGLTTDISRRNQAMICSRLGVEHIIRAPDILRKRRYIRKNVEAWFKKPHLGMIPLFQAGDKEFYHYGRTLRKEMGIGLTVLCSGYQLEQREFMIGFMGVDQPPLRNNQDFYYNPTSTKVRLAFAYILEYLKNPSYINESFFQSIWSFVMSFIYKSDFLYLFKYIQWKEEEVERVLKEELGWVADSDYGENQWRMGDGQTAFNNYLYHRLAGFTEFDSFRSNQIREGLLSRDQALELIQKDNLPKYQMIQSFCQTVGLNFEETMGRVERIPPIV